MLGSGASTRPLLSSNLVVLITETTQRLTQTVLTSSRNVDECKPRRRGGGMKDQADGGVIFTAGASRGTACSGARGGASGGAAPEPGPGARALHSSTIQIDVSAFHGM
jgi:hypothetical protein